MIKKKNGIISFLLIISFAFIFSKNCNKVKETSIDSRTCNFAEVGEFGFSKPCVTKKEELFCERMKVAYRQGRLIPLLKGEWHGSDYPSGRLFKIDGKGNILIRCKGMNDPDEISQQCGEGNFNLTVNGFHYLKNIYSDKTEGISKSIECEIEYADGVGYGIRFTYGTYEDKWGKQRLSLWQPLDHPEITHSIKIDVVGDN